MMDDNFTDYFEPENVPDDKPKEETPEQREEREIKETTIDRTRGGRRRLFLWSLVVVLAGFLVYTVWSRYFHPYRTDCQERGVIMDVANEGTLVKTYECKMISEKYISDTVSRAPAAASRCTTTSTRAWCPGAARPSALPPRLCPTAPRPPPTPPA